MEENKTKDFKRRKCFVMVLLESEKQTEGEKKIKEEGKYIGQRCEQMWRELTQKNKRPMGNTDRWENRLR